MKVFCYICLLLLAFATASCVYDYRPDVAGLAGYVAIEGDILVGDTCRFDVRLSTDLGDEQNVGDPLTYTLRVESSDGAVYRQQDSLVDLTSTDVGGMFSPEPSELRGNIVNVDDSDELVLGFIGVSTVSRVSMYINNYEVRFSYWRNGYRFAFYSNDGPLWLPGECIDCTRIGGGTKERPSWWPNNHK